MQDADTLKSRVERYRSENSIVCPRCGSTWHKTTLRCNCGYEFLPRHSPEVPQDSRLRRLFWPSIYDSDSARRAGMNGAQASFIVAGVTTLFALLSMVGVISVVEPWAIVDAVIVASLGLMIRRMSRAAAVAALLMFLIERLFAGIEHGLKAEIGVVAIVVAFSFVSGVRGTVAWHDFRRSD